MAALQGFIDPTKAAHYPVVLSDSLLGKENKEVFTSIKYNFKPDEKDEKSQAQGVIHPSDPSAQSYNLTVTDKDDDYAYQGTRQPADGQYVLVFSPEEKVFVLHRLDSTFNMNVTSTPWDQDQDSLRTTYPHLTTAPREPETNNRSGDSKRRKTDTKPKAQPRAQSRAQSKVQPKAQAKAQPRKTRAIQKEPTPEEESDDGLTIEYPDGPPRKSNNSLAHALRSEPVRQIESEEEESDRDEEERNKDVDTIKLPSPAGGHQALNEEDEDYLDLDLEAELEQALEKETEVNRADESSESEEE